MANFLAGKGSRTWLFIAVAIAVLGLTALQASASEVWGTGLNGSGQLGLGDNTLRSSFIEVADLSNPVAIAGGEAHSLALTVDGKVWAAGLNDAGQLGVGDNSNRNIFTETTGITGSVVAIAAAGNHSLAVTSDGKVWATGLNDAGQLGLSDTSNRNEFTEVTGISESFIAVAAGAGHSLALTSDGRIFATGLNASGQLGQGDNSNRSVFTEVSSLSDIAAISGGGWHSLVITDDGKILAAGMNDAGQLGIGNNSNHNLFTEATGISNVIDIAGGEKHSLALTSDGKVWATGANNVGQLGLGESTSTNLNIFTQSIYVEDVIAVASGPSNHSLALKSDGTIWGSGYNLNGELGLGYAIFFLPFELVYMEALYVDDATAIAAGGAHSLTIRGELISTNQPPEVGPIIAPEDPVSISLFIFASAEFTDPDANDTHTATWNWGDGTVAPGGITYIDAPSGTAGVVTCEHLYLEPGVYEVTLTVTDAAGLSDQSIFQYLVVYDSSAGFVTGGGWINSNEGAYIADPLLTGKATFGFVSRYNRGRNTPTGNTQFQFKAGNLRFESRSYDWMVIAGARVQFRGVGTINGGGTYNFMITAIDGSRPGGQGVDRFRIKIWDAETDALIYDNQLGANDSDDPVTALGGGNIKIHN